MSGAATCRECGVAGCRDLFDLLLALEFEHPEPYGELHAVTVPAWFLQHPRRARAHDRDGQWRLLHLYTRAGLGGVHAFTRARVAANHRDRGGGLPDVPGLDVPDLPDVVGTDRTIADVAGPGRDFPAEGHAQRVRTWIEAIVAPGG